MVDPSSDSAIQSVSVLGPGYQAVVHVTALFQDHQNQPQSLSLSISLFGFPPLGTPIGTHVILPEKQQLSCLKIV